MARLGERTSLLVRYIASNILIVMIPVVLLGYLFIARVYDQLLDNITSNQQGALTHVALGLDEDISVFTSYALQIARDAYITPYNLQKRGLSQIEARRRIEQYRINIGYASALAIYLPDTDTLYTDNGQISLTNFANESYAMRGELTMTMLRDMLAHCTDFATLPADAYLAYAAGGSAARFTLWAMPYPAGSTRPFGAIVAVIDTAFYRERLSAATGGLSLFLRVEDAAGTAQYEYSSGYAPSVGEALSERQVFRLSADAARTNWSIVALIPKDQFSHALVTGGDNSTPLIILGVALGSILLGIGFAYSQFKPIERVDAYVRGMASGKDAHRKNELMNISAAIHDAISSNQQLKRQVEAHRPLIAENLLNEMLLGNRAESEEAYTLRLREAGIRLEGRYLCLLLIQPDAPHSKALLEELVRIAQAACDAECYSLILASNRCAALILSRESARTDDLRVLAERIADNAYARLNATIAIGISVAFERRTEADEHLLEAASALEAAKFSQARIVCYQDLQPEASDHSFRTELLRQRMRLRQSAAFGSAENFRDAAEAMRALFARCPNPQSLAHLLGALVCDGMQIVAEYELNEADHLSEQLAQAKGLDEYLKAMARIREALQETHRARCADAQSALAQAVTAYVCARLCDATFNLATLAAAFGMSETRMSRFFKQHTGEAFKDYLASARMCEACRLLSETEMKVSEIVKQVGYADATSFSRRFVGEYGVSAGAWRKMARAKPPK